MAVDALLLEESSADDAQELCSSDGRSGLEPGAPDPLLPRNVKAGLSLLGRPKGELPKGESLSRKGGAYDDDDDDDGSPKRRLSSLLSSSLGSGAFAFFFLILSGGGQAPHQYRPLSDARATVPLSDTASETHDFALLLRSV